MNLAMLRIRRVAIVVIRSRTLGGGYAEMDDKKLEGDCFADTEKRLAISCSVALRASASRVAVEKLRWPRPLANTSVIGV